MIEQLFVVMTVLAAVMIGWYLLQSATRKHCRGTFDGDVLERLLEGCGGCDDGSSCKRSDKKQSRCRG